MAVIGINHYNLRADRATLETLRDFYSQILGLEVGYRPPFRSSGYWLYAGEQPLVHLTEARPDEIRLKGSTSTFDHLAFSCEDYEAFIERLRRSNVEFTVDRVPLVGQLQIFFSDPAGNGIELSFPLPL